MNRTSLLRYILFPDLQWSFVCSQVLKEGPLPRYIFPRRYESHDPLEWFMQEKSASVESTLNEKSAPQFRMFLQATDSLEIVPALQGASNIFLTYRGSDRAKKDSALNQQSAFRSPEVFKDFLALVQEWDDAERLEALKTLRANRNYQAEAEVLSQTLRIDD